MIQINRITYYIALFVIAILTLSTLLTLIAYYLTSRKLYKAATTHVTATDTGHRGGNATDPPPKNLLNRLPHIQNDDCND